MRTPSPYGAARIFPTHELYTFDEIADSLEHNSELSPAQFTVMMLVDDGDAYAYNRTDGHIYTIEEHGHCIDCGSRMGFEDLLIFALGFD